MLVANLQEVLEEQKGVSLVLRRERVPGSQRRPTAAGVCRRLAVAVVAVALGRVVGEERRGEVLVELPKDSAPRDRFRQVTRDQRGPPPPRLCHW